MGPYTRVDPGDTLASVGPDDVNHEFMHEEIADGLEASEVMSFIYAFAHYR